MEAHVKVKDLIARLKSLPQSAEVFISDQQGNYTEANSPYETDEETESDASGEVLPKGSVIISFENT